MIVSNAISTPHISYSINTRNLSTSKQKNTNADNNFDNKLNNFLANKAILGKTQINFCANNAHSSSEKDIREITLRARHLLNMSRWGEYDEFTNYFKQFPNETQIDILKYNDPQCKQPLVWDIANENYRLYAEITKDYDDDTRFDLLSNYYSDYDGACIAQRIASYNSDEAYLKITDGMSEDYKIRLLKMQNKKTGCAIAHTVSCTPDQYYQATKDFSRDTQFELLNLTSDDKDKRSVGECLDLFDSNTYNELIENIKQDPKYKDWQPPRYKFS